MSIWRKAGLGVFVLLALAGGLCWIYADRILNELIRPQIEEALNQALGAKVGIEHLHWTAHGLDIQGLQLAQAGGLSLLLPRIETEFSLPELFRRKLKAVRLVDPKIHYTQSASQTPAGSDTLWQPLDLPLTIDALEITGGEVNLELKGRNFQLRQLTFQGALRPDFPFQLDLLIGPDTSYPLHLEGQVAVDVSLALTLVRLDFQRRALLTEPLRLSLGGSALGQGRVSLQLAQVDHQLLRALLTALAIEDPLPESLHFSLTGAQVNLQLLAAETRLGLKVASAEISQAQTRIPLVLDQLLLIQKKDAWTLQAEITGPATTRLDVTGRSAPAEGSMSFTLALQQAGSLFLKAAGNPEQFQFSLAPFDLARLVALTGPNLVPAQLQALRGLTASGRVSGNLEQGWNLQGELAAQNIALADLDLNKLSAEFNLDASGDRLSIKLPGFRAELARGEELRGQIEGTLSALLSAERFNVRLEQLKLTQLGYLATDGQTGLGEGRLELTGSVKGGFSQEPFAIELAGKVEAAEFLAGAFYADLSQLSGNLHLRGQFSPAQQKLALEELRIDLPSVGTAGFTGQIGTTELTLHTQVDLPNLAEAYGKHLGPWLTESRPLLQGLTLEGGLALDADIHWQPAGWQLSGDLLPHQLDAFWAAHDLELAAGSGRIPLKLFAGQPPEEGFSAERAGEISFSGLGVGLASLAAGELKLAAAPNRLHFRSPLKLGLGGGQVVIEDLMLGVNNQGPFGSVRLNIDAIDLETLAHEMGLPRLQGTFTGDLGLIRYAERQISTDGTASVDIFGGRVLLRNLRYQAPFSSYPVFFADIDFSGIDLLQATRTFEFGEMNGIIDGQIHGLRLFGATPSAFQARLETRSSGKRNISVKALKNLTIISQGGLSAALSRGVYRFIDFYRYQKIGFACRLENDTFTLIGTARSDSSKYLVAGSFLPPRIDITTTTPTISFKEMLKRLNRIDRTGG